MTKALASRGERDSMGRSYRFFYNPMWGCFGDRTAGPPGTYYHRAPEPVDPFWHVYDQVLLRPSLMGSLVELQILDSDGRDSLLTQHGLPKKSGGSDHLPVLFRLDI